MAAAPRTADEAHTAAVTDRRVRVLPADDGMAILLGAAARTRRDAAQDRDLAPRPHPDAAPQLTGRPTSAPPSSAYADALIELADRYLTDSDPTGASTASPPPSRSSSNLTTLIGDDDQPGELIGYGPIPASLARRIAADDSGTWQRLVTDPTGVPHRLRPRPATDPRPTSPTTSAPATRSAPTPPATAKPTTLRNSTTPSTGTTAAPPTPTTSPPSAPATTTSNTTPAGIPTTTRRHYLDHPHRPHLPKPPTRVRS